MHIAQQCGRRGSGDYERGGHRWHGRTGTARPDRAGAERPHRRDPAGNEPGPCRRSAPGGQGQVSDPGPNRRAYSSDWRGPMARPGQSAGRRLSISTRPCPPCTDSSMSGVTAVFDAGNNPDLIVPDAPAGAGRRNHQSTHLRLRPRPQLAGELDGGHVSWRRRPGLAAKLRMFWMPSLELATGSCRSSSWSVSAWDPARWRPNCPSRLMANMVHISQDAAACAPRFTRSKRARLELPLLPALIPWPIPVTAARASVPFTA